MHILHANMQDVQGPSLLLPLLRSPFQGELLAWLYLHPEEAYSATDLAKRLGVSQSTVSREADRLASSGLISERKAGNMRLISANQHTLVARPLTELLAVTYGPLAVLGDLLSRIAGIQEAFLYGSWAARYRGEPGDVPRDVDVLVVGEADEDDLYDAARAAEPRLGREVNIRRVSPAAWRRPADDPFLTSVKSRPVVPLDLTKEGE
jgi:DNA-binding transcriptional ArsR family regulator